MTKAQYDGAERAVRTYTTDGGSDATWADALNVTGDAVLEETRTDYDGNDNPKATITFQRAHDETRTDDLDAIGGPRARAYFTATYYDGLDRPTAAVDMGNFHGGYWDRPSDPPNRRIKEALTNP